MKRVIITFIAGLLAVTFANAQEYKINRSTGKIVINLSSVTVEGYKGAAIVFSSQHKSDEMDDRAKGLIPLNGLGLKDNTGLGIYVSEKGGIVDVSQVTSKDEAIKILVPEGMNISFTCNKVSNINDAVFKNLKSELDISVSRNRVFLSNVTGPVAVNTIYGSVEAVFVEPVEGPISIVSINAAIDVAIPQTTKADLALSTSRGDIYAAPELKIDLVKPSSPREDTDDSGIYIKGELNGGGIEFSVKSSYGKIYLRKTVL